jgi:glycosyltransferase involved in cell wall biosynthesis
MRAGISLPWSALPENTCPFWCWMMGPRMILPTAPSQLVLKSSARFRYILERDYPAVITLDGDGQHDPAEIPAFLAAWQEQPVGLIIGRRDFSRMPLIRRLANTLGGVLFSLAVGHRIADNQSGYRLINRQLMQFMLEDDEPGFELEVDMVVLALRNKLGLAWVPIKTLYTGGSSHIKPLPHLLNFLRVCLKAHQAMRNS